MSYFKNTFSLRKSKRDSGTDQEVTNLLKALRFTRKMEKILYWKEYETEALDIRIKQ